MPSTAAPMSPRRWPSTTSSIAASSDRRVTSMSRVDSASISPTATVIAASACQPSMIAPQSMEMMSPSSSTTVSLGMPCTITSLGDVHTTAGNPWYPRKFERAPRRSITSRAARSRSSGGRARHRRARTHTSCISATTLPAAPHERDLLPGLARDHRDSEAKCSSISLTMRWNTSSPSPTPSTIDQLAESLVEVDDRHGLLLVELEAPAAPPPRCRRRAARRAPPHLSHVQFTLGGRFTW